MSSTSERAPRFDAWLVKREAERLYYEEGLTLAEVGERFGVTRERVRQWLVERGRDEPRAGGPAAQRRRRARRREARIEACRAQAARRYREGLLTEEIAAELALPAMLVKEALDRELDPLEKRMIYGWRRGRVARPDERLLADLSAAAASLGPDMTADDFAAWARARGLNGPQSYMARFGSWREARRLAGLPPVKGPKAPRTDRISLSECVEALRAVWEELGHPPTVAEYERAARAAGLPSVATVRHRAGRWMEALLLVEDLGEDW